MTNRVRARSPVRVLDAGGWTDTWFSGRGTVCNLAVEPGIEVLAQRSARDGADGAGGVVLHIPTFGDHYRFALDEPLPWRHPLLETTVCRCAPPGCMLDVTVTSPVPAGSGMGTSAAVVVALILALEALSERHSDPATLARAAHEVETTELGMQSGIQDHIAATHGGANLIEIDAYPEASVRPLEVASVTWDQLAQRTITAYLGVAHDSSAVHRAVISRLADTDAEPLLHPLRSAAVLAAVALQEGRIEDYGAAMILNTEAQAALHPDLVGRRAREVIGRARAGGAVGWKVNGAGGEGGTVTVVSRDDPAELVDRLGALEYVTLLPLSLPASGARIVDCD